MFFVCLLLLFFVFLLFYCLAVSACCFSIIVWTPAVLSVLYACVLYFCLCPCSGQQNMFHMERRSRNTLIITVIIKLKKGKDQRRKKKILQLSLTTMQNVRSTVHQLK